MDEGVVVPCARWLQCCSFFLRSCVCLCSCEFVDPILWVHVFLNAELKSKKDRMVSSLKEIRQASRTQETDENRAKSLVESLEQKIKSCKLDIVGCLLSCKKMIN